VTHRVYVVGGPARVGKSALAQRLLRSDGIPWLPTDVLRTVLRRVLPELDELDQGNVSIANASGRFVFNTMVQNSSKGGGSRIGGIDCTPASGLTMLISRNIVSENGAGKAFGGNCTVPTNANYIGKIADAKFTNTTEYKLTMMSPGTILRDDLESLPDCMYGNPPKYIDDYEGQTRPAGFCDRGADELKP